MFLRNALPVRCLSIPSLKRTIVVQALIVFSILACLFLMRRPVAELRLRLEGYVLSADEFAKPLQIDRPGASANVGFLLKNLTNDRVSVVGIETSCGCLSITELPFTILPRQELELTFVVKSDPRWRGKLITQHARLLLDVPSPGTQLQIHTRVADANSSGQPES